MPRTTPAAMPPADALAHGLPIERTFSTEGEDPFDSVAWERRDTAIKSHAGEVIFEQKDVAFPASWSQLAANVVASKYFYGALSAGNGSPADGRREHSLRQLVHRVTRTIADWGRDQHYFASEADAEAFYDELTWLCVNQFGAFNSPVWFNVGLHHQYGVRDSGGKTIWGWDPQSDSIQSIDPYERPQGSACFIIAVGDSIDDIWKLMEESARLFKFGSGVGADWSTLRSTREKLSGGGIPSGPVSFMKVQDATGGTIKSGGKTRRAAIMQTLKSWHPDIMEFVTAKMEEEKKAHALIEQGYDGSFNGPAYGSVAFQNVNQSVRVDDAFMRAAGAGAPYALRAVTTGETVEEVPARRILDAIAEGTWVCGDPGLQYEDTIQRWHTCPNSAPINSSNPCVTGDTLVATEDGLRRIDSLVGTTPRVVGLDGALHPATRVIETGMKPVYRLRTKAGYEVRLTADHRVWTENRGDVLAAELTRDDMVRLTPSPFGTEGLEAEVAEFVGLMLSRQDMAGGDGASSSEDVWEDAVTEKAGRVARRLGDGSRDEHADRFGRGTTGGVLVAERRASAGTGATVTSAAVVQRLLAAYTAPDGDSSAQRLTERALRLDREATAALLRGLFTAAGVVSDHGARSQYVGLSSASEVLLRQVQLLLLSFGVRSKIVRNRRPLGQMTALIPEGDDLREQRVEQLHSLRVCRSSRMRFQREIGFMEESGKAAQLRALNARVRTYRDRLVDRVDSLALLGVEPVYDLTEPATSHFAAGGVAVHNCSEYMFLDNSACFAPETRISTPHGLRTVEELYERQQSGELVTITTELHAEHDHRRLLAHRPAVVTEVGVKPVFKMDLKDGRSIRVTDDHKFLTGQGQWKELRHLDLKRDRVHIRLTGDPVTFTSEWERVRRWQTLGWLTGDGVFSKGNVALVFRPQEKETAAWMVDEFNRLTEDAHAWADSRRAVRTCSLYEQESGVLQTTSKAACLVTYLEEDLGMQQATATGKDVPTALHALPNDLKVAYLQGLFSADGCIRSNPGATEKEVMLASSAPALLRSVQLMLSDLGITSRITWTHPEGRTNPQGQLHIYNQQARRFHALIGFPCNSNKSAESRRIARSTFEAAAKNPRPVGIASITPDGEETVYDLTEPVTRSVIAEGMIAHNCNLASLNLRKFQREDGSFDVDCFRAAARIFLTAQEILVDNAGYPSAKIARNSHDYRPLGLGFANLGALLMAMGLPYDSDEGRAVAAALMAIEHCEGYARSAEIAANEQIGPFNGFEKNREPFLRVMRMHRDAVAEIDRSCPAYLKEAAHESADRMVALGEQHGYRNAQATVLAPTGTIGFMMDCDTTGIEPDIALVKYKLLAGKGDGMMKIVNQTVGDALAALGYTAAEAQAILAYIDEHDTIEGAPALKDEHLPVFDCAFKPHNGERSIHYGGHIKMMAACQPFISGAISKTVNLPESATPEDIAGAYLQGWQLGLKAVAIYRENSKRSQPLSTKEGGNTKNRDVEVSGDGALHAAALGEPEVVERIVYQPIRKRLPDERPSITHKFSIAGHEGYLHIGLYPDTSLPGEIFITMAKQGSTVSGMMDAFATAISLALQYGVPLEDLCAKFSHMRFEPAGFTNNPQVPIAKSIMDYIFRYCSVKFLGHAAPESESPSITDDVGEGAGNPSDAVAAEVDRSGPAADEVQMSIFDEPVVPSPLVGQTVDAFLHTADRGGAAQPAQKTAFRNQEDAPACPNCGSITVRAGACYSCVNCGASTGCG